jgi:ribosomal protein L16/L10AE
MSKTELLKQPRISKYKKWQRGSFKVIKYIYNLNCIANSNNNNLLCFVSQGSGFLNWKNVTNFKQKISRLFRKKKNIKFRYNFSLNWSFSYKTHKSRMGKGKGVVNVDNWCVRIQSGKSIFFLKSRGLIAKGVRTFLKRSSLILPVAVKPL